ALGFALVTGPLIAQGQPTDKELIELKAQRDLADAFMRKAAEKALANADKADKTAREGLQKRLKQKRFFDTGTTREELIAFQGMVKEADASGVKVSGDALQELILASVARGVDKKDIKAIAEDVAKSSGASSS